MRNVVTYLLPIVIFIILFFVVEATAIEKPNTPQKTCVTEECHTDYSQKAYVHGPVGLGDCKSCHKPLDPAQHTYELVRQGKDLCEYCHLDQTGKMHTHQPLETGDCSQCHDPHSSDNKFLLPEKSVADLCAKCHETTKGMTFLHGPTAVGECSICHNSHSSDYEKLLTVAPDSLCFSCHVVTQNELQKFEFVHEPAKGDCIGCHNPHGAANAMMLKAQAPDLCYPCHEDIKNIAETSKYKHSAVVQEDGCMHCHTPHASTIKNILRNDPATLCLSCHDKPVGVTVSEVLPSFTKEIEDKKYMHGPVAQKDCEGCHISHGSEYFRLLVKEYPPEFYAPFKKENYDLCFSCHPDTLALTKETIDLTDFRNGNLNLHFVHVNKEQRGRTCRSCHATHASDLPKHIRESVPYGMWDLPIQFTKTDTGGGCKPGCHLPYSYDRENPQIYEQPAGETVTKN
jgi:predicted CXXCH cytochrome family protein